MILVMRPDGSKDDVLEPQRGVNGKADHHGEPQDECACDDCIMGAWKLGDEERQKLGNNRYEVPPNDEADAEEAEDWPANVVAPVEHDSNSSGALAALSKAPLETTES